MKKFLIVVIALVISTNVFSQGIEFEHGTFNEALIKAKKENKLLFMDCYTSWCGPCKILAKKVFPQQVVGAYFNEHFVSVKIDMEKGEGVELKKKYDVQAFPTLLFMDATGKVLHTMVGGSDAARLIAEAKTASDPSMRIGALHARYTNGEREVNFLVKYVKALGKAYKKEEAKQVGEEFLANTPNEKLLNVEAFTIIGYSSALKYGSKAYKHIIANKDKIIANENLGEKSYNGIIRFCTYNYLMGVVKTGTLAELRVAIEACKKDFIAPNQTELEGKLLGEFYLTNKQFEKWFDTKRSIADEIMKTNKKDGMSMYVNIAYQILKDPTLEDAGLYDKAIAITVKAIKLDETFIGAYYCLAALYKKIGDKAKAIENINIFLAKNAEKGGQSDARADKLKAEIENM